MLPIKHLVVVVWLGVLLAPAGAWAETAYVSDKIHTEIRAQADRASAVLKSVSTGAALEVLERGPGMTRVRDADGTEGWIDAGMLTTEPPARNRLDSMKTQVDGLKGQLEKAQAALAQESAKSADLAKKLAEKSALLDKTGAEKTQLQSAVQAATQAATAAAAAAAPEPPAAPAPATPATGDSLWTTVAWGVFSFAMLVLGFFAGMVYLREVNRKKMGGMYLRI
jgi:SH3 domain protein